MDTSPGRRLAADEQIRPSDDERFRQLAQESQRRLATLMSNLPGMAYRCRNDPQWSMEFISDGCIPLTGYKPADFTAHHKVAYGEIIHPDDRQAVWEGVQTAIDEHRHFQLEYRIATASGEERWIREQGVAVYGDTGKVEALEGLMTDVTDWKRTEETLRESEQRFRTLVEQAGDGFELLDEDGRYLDMNHATCRQMGYTREELLHMRIPDIDPVVDWEYYRSQFPAMMEQPLTFESVHTRKDGTRFPVEVTTSVIRMGNACRVVALVRDITDRKRVEEELRRHREHLEELVQHRTAQLRALTGELAQAQQRERRRIAQLLHDHLQQLLVAARFKLVMLTREAQGSSPAHAAQAAIDLLDQCLAESRSLTTELCPPVLYDAGLASAFRWLARWMEEKHGFAVDVRVEEHTDMADKATQVFLFEAVRELLFNFVKHARVNRAEVIVTKAPGEILQIEVRDAGIGFDASCLDAQAAASGTIGLFSIRERLGLLGARLEISTSPGQGTRATICVPLDRETPTVLPGTAEAAVSGTAVSDVSTAQERNGLPSLEREGLIRLLLVDDHPILRKGLADLVRSSPEITVVGEAGDGEEAVAMALRLEPDVVLMDVTMPRMDGIEATRRITSALGNVRVIGLSMHEDEEMATAMRDAGAVAYMTKGGDPDALIASLLTRAVPP